VAEIFRLVTARKENVSWVVVVECSLSRHFALRKDIAGNSYLPLKNSQLKKVLWYFLAKD